MYARIEVALRPEFADPSSKRFLRQLELALPEVRKEITWARQLDVYWIGFEADVGREFLIPAVTEIFWDRVLCWLFSGDLIPSAAGRHGNLVDLFEVASSRSGKFWGLERRYRPGVTDSAARSVIEAFEIMLGRPLPTASAATGKLLLLEGAALTEEKVGRIAQTVFCNELMESWTVIPDAELRHNERFHPERVKFELPKVLLKGKPDVKSLSLQSLKPAELAQLSRDRLWALSEAEMVAIQKYYANPETVEARAKLGLKDPTDVELEILAQTWSEHCKHKIFKAEVAYRDATQDDLGQLIPKSIDGLFKQTIAATTEDLKHPDLLSVFSDNAGIVAWDPETAVCVKVETHNSPSALDPYGGALTGIVGVNRDILGCGLGAKPVGNTDVFCVAELDHAATLPEGVHHPRRILDGIRRGVEDGGNKSGIPTVNGALVFDDRYLGRPLVYCGTLGVMPRRIRGRDCFEKRIESGDLVVMVGGRIGKDGIHGATVSSLALSESSPTSAVQLGDPITQRRMTDFLLEARDRGLYRALTDNGAGGLSSSVGELASLTGGVSIDVSKAKTKYPGLKPFELVISESQERMTLAVPPEFLSDLQDLGVRRGVDVSVLGQFNDSGRFDVLYDSVLVGSLNLGFLHEGTPRLSLSAEWRGGLPTPKPVVTSFKENAPQTLERLLSRPNIASKEWLIRQYDHEVQGATVIKPLHTAQSGSAQAYSGANDGSVLKISSPVSSNLGLAVGCGIYPQLSDHDPYLMAMSAVDEAIRNVIAVGASFGAPESRLALCDNFCWPDPTEQPAMMAALVRACYGMREACLGLGVPLVSGKDSMKNDYRGTRNGDPVTISIVPTLLMTAIARLPDIRGARSADFKPDATVLYLVGGQQLRLRGSEVGRLFSIRGGDPEIPCQSPHVSTQLPAPEWSVAQKIYSWLGGGIGKKGIAAVRSVHDVSEGGLLVAVAESLLARGLGADLEVPAESDPWEFCFGEGFHSLVISVAALESSPVETECREMGIPLRRIGSVTPTGKLDVKWQGESISVPLSVLRQAWKKEGYWK